MYLDIRNHIDWCVLFLGAFGVTVTEVLERILPIGGVAFDVGANIGVHTLTMARIVGESGKVFAFEPNPAIRKVLDRNVSANNYTAIVRSSPNALGSSEDTLELRIPTQDSEEGCNPGLASLVALESPHYRIPVPVRT